MESKIITQEKNPFLDREEYTIEIVSKLPPTFDEVKKVVGLNEELTVVKKVAGNFGSNIFKVTAVVYGSIESKEKIEVIPQKVRKKMAAEKKAAEEEAKKAEEEAKAAKEAEKKAAEEAAPKNIGVPLEGKAAEEEAASKDSDVPLEGKKTEAEKPTESEKTEDAPAEEAAPKDNSVPSESKEKTAPKDNGVPLEGK